jgi:putative protease
MAEEKKGKEEKEIGKVTHYFTKIGVAVIELSDTLKVGDTIHIKGATSDFNQKVESMQIEHENVESAKKGDAVGLKTSEHAREHDIVYKIVE